MTSQPSREDLEKFLHERGLPWGEIVKFMAAMDLFVLAKIHEARPMEDARPDLSRLERKYKCKVCGRQKLLSEFPQAKRDNTRIISPCSYCAGRSVLRKPLTRRAFTASIEWYARYP